MASHSTTPVRDVGLDLLRVVAVIEVVMFHLKTRPRVAPVWLTTLFDQGHIGVDIFFVLSGFLLGSWLMRRIAETPGEPLSFPVIRNFLRRRYFKTLPPYFALLLMLAILGQLHVTPSYLTFTSNYFDPKGYSAFWSLDTEEMFYLCLPLSLWFLTRARSRAAIGLFVGMAVLLSPLARYAAWRGEEQYLYHEDIYWPTHTRLDGLVIGVLLATMRIRYEGAWQRLRRFRLPLGLLGAGILVASQRFNATTGVGRPWGLAITEYLALAIGAGCLVVALYGITSRARWATVVSTLAKATYAIYLAHLLGFDLYQKYVEPRVGELSPNQTVFGMLLVAAVPAVALYQFESVIHRNQDRIVAWMSARWRRLVGDRKAIVATE